MIPVFASALADIAMSVIHSILPDTPADKLEILKLQIQQQAMENDLLKGQLSVNEAEASNESIFVSGARPAVIWICAAGFAWQFVVQPILLFMAAVFHYTVLVPVFDTATMTTALFALLGISGMRSYDKKQKLSNQ